MEMSKHVQHGSWEGEVGPGATGVGQRQNELQLHMHPDFIAIEAAKTYSRLFQVE